MSNPAEYREYAANCVHLAQKTSASADKARLLNMAEAWLGLAECAESTQRRLNGLEGADRKTDGNC